MMDLFTALRLLALRDVLAFKKNSKNSKIKEDAEYSVRHIFRWYSKTFYTPLDHVARLPLQDVMRAFWEEKYEALDEDELEEVRVQALKTDEQISQEAYEADLADVDASEIAEEIRLAQAANDLITSLEKLTLPKHDGMIATPAASRPLRDTELIPASSIVEVKPGISMTFAGADEDLGLDEDAFGLARR